MMQHCWLSLLIHTLAKTKLVRGLGMPGWLRAPC